MANPAPKQDLKALVTNKATTKTVTISEKFNQLAPQFNKAMPGFLRKIGGAETLSRIALTEFRKNQALAACSFESLAGSLMTCAQLGLMPGPQGHVYLVPFKGSVTVVIGYRGLIELVRRSGELSTIAAVTVHDGDEVDIDLANATVQHKYNEKVVKTEETFRFVYAMAALKDGSRAIAVMNKEEVNAIRKRSQASGSGPWSTDWLAMAAKTCLKRLCSKGSLPLSTELQKLIGADETVRRDVTLEPIHMMDLPQQSFIPSTDGVPVDESGWKQTEMIQTEEPATDIFGEEVANG